MLPADDVERLERLVGEVERMADLDVAVVGGGREQHVGHLAVVAPARIAETMQRSAPSASRTSMKRRNQRRSVGTSAVAVGSGWTMKRGGVPSQSRATADRP